jgi:hypothetical protein
MVARGAEVSFGDLIDTSLKRIIPPDVPRSDDPDERWRDMAFIRIAKTGLAFLIENAATDALAKRRRSKRELELFQAIQLYNEAREQMLRESRGKPPRRGKGRSPG